MLWQIVLTFDLNKINLTSNEIDDLFGTLRRALSREQHAELLRGQISGLHTSQHPSVETWEAHSEYPTYRMTPDREGE